MENIKPEDVLEKHIGSSCVIDERSILIVMREYAQIACSTLSEEIRVKDERIEELEMNVYILTTLIQKTLFNKGIIFLRNEDKEIMQDILNRLTPPPIPNK